MFTDGKPLSIVSSLLLFAACILHLASCCLVRTVEAHCHFPPSKTRGVVNTDGGGWVDRSQSGRGETDRGDEFAASWMKIFIPGAASHIGDGDPEAHIRC